MAAAVRAQSPGQGLAVPGSVAIPSQPAAAAAPVPGASLATSASALPAASGAYVLQPGDIVGITVYREPDLSVTSRLSAAGEITFPMLGQIKLAGLSAFAAQDLIAKKLDVDLIVNPQVSLTILQYTKEYFTILGEVAHPGLYEFPPEHELTLLEAVGTAGGFTMFARYTAVQITRTEEGKTVTFKANARDIASSKAKDHCVIHPGDVITVRDSWF